ncbi:acetyl-CoA synthase subunit gamma [bacterium]|nr:acetyl-CoA synthase subunit gamma [bacterium]
MAETYIVNTQETPAGIVPQITTDLRMSDYEGTFKARFNISRMDYKLAPRLYAVNQPDANSVVLVSANYKMSFDYLRKELKKIKAWILVLDTKGINVWCAAGKGTFGTQEIIRRIQETRLAQIVKHRRLIVPQLGAPGVAAHEVKKASGFSVTYGPVRAQDLPAFLRAGMKTTEAMRRVQFTLFDRMVLIPVEVIGHLKYVLWGLVYFALVSGFAPGVFSWEKVLFGSSIAAVFLFSGLIAGTVLLPVLLPFIPGPAFAWKGALLGLGVFALLQWLLAGIFTSTMLSILGWALIVVSLASFSGMNFTGTSTYTSLSGVLKEMKIALPLQIGGFSLGVILWTISSFI